MNGIESSESHGEHQSTTSSRGSTGANMNYNNDGSVYHSETGIPLDKLKQMLSTQLEYYFSRYVYQLFFCLSSFRPTCVQVQGVQRLVI